MPRELLEPRADEVARAAEVSVLSALQLRAKERFVVLHDRASLPTATALAECALAARPLGRQPKCTAQVGPPESSPQAYEQ